MRLVVEGSCVEDIKVLDKFGAVNLEGLLRSCRGVEDLPEKLRISVNMVRSDASVASFVCFCKKNGVGLNVVADRTGLGLNEIEGIVREASELGMLDELAGEFLKSV
jgi:hypothetical protein